MATVSSLKFELGLVILGLIVGVVLLAMYISEPTWNVVLGVVVAMDFFYLTYVIYRYRKKTQSVGNDDKFSVQKEYDAFAN